MHKVEWTLLQYNPQYFFKSWQCRRPEEQAFLEKKNIKIIFPKEMSLTAEFQTPSPIRVALQPSPRPLPRSLRPVQSQSHSYLHQGAEGSAFRTLKNSSNAGTCSACPYRSNSTEALSGKLTKTTLLTQPAKYSLNVETSSFAVKGAMPAMEETSQEYRKAEKAEPACLHYAEDPRGVERRGRIRPRVSPCPAPRFHSRRKDQARAVQNR